jgi:uncharacterized DUF497 family protein
VRGRLPPDDLLWDENTEEHIAYHDVDVFEVYEVVFATASRFYRAGGRYHVLGRTDPGRYLFVVLEFVRRDLAAVITARPMDEREKRRYRRK